MQFKISIEKALEVARKNLQEHITELAEAQVGWTEKVKDELDKLNSVIDREGVRTSDEALRKLFYVKPVDNRAMYSRYIGALELALENDKIIEMDEDEYDRLFNDNWDWRKASKISNSTYTGKGL